MSYVYVRTDISVFIPDAHMQGLLRLFLESLYMNDYIGACKSLAFTPVPADVKRTAMNGISNDIKWAFFSTENPSNDNPWSFEIDTRKLDGAGDFVISSKRRSYQGIEVEDVLAMEAAMEGQLNSQIGMLNELGQEIIGFTTRDSSRINAALVLSALSFTLWCMLIVGICVNKMFFGGSTAHKYNAPHAGDQI